MTSVEVVRNDNGQEMLSVTSITKNISDEAGRKFKATIDAINNSGGVVGDDGKRQKISFEQAKFTAGTTVKVRTYIAYRSEYQPSFSLTIDEYEKVLQPGVLVYDSVLMGLSDYSEKMVEKFEAEHVRLRQLSI